MTRQRGSQLRLEDQVTNRVSLLQLIAANVDDLLSVEDEGDRYVYVSPSSARLFGWRQEELQGGPISAVQHQEDSERVADERARLRRLERASVSLRYRLRTRSGEYRWVESRSRICDELPQYVVTITRDIQDQVQYLHELEWRATYDSLTGLLNRRAIEAALDAELARSQRQGQVLSIALFDVDSLKRVNDTYGHMAGDALLHSLAQCAARCKRAYDILGRWGGDEFILLLPNTAAEEAVAIIGRVRAALAQDLPGVTVSFGVSSSADTDSAHRLLIGADSALYQGKRRGGDEILRWCP